jgi:hypothetical protein
MPVNNFDIDNWNELKKVEFLRDHSITLFEAPWIKTFTDDFDEDIKKSLERKRYDDIWKKIKLKMKW